MLTLEEKNKIKAFDIIKEHYVINGFDELIPNRKNWDKFNKEIDFLRERLKK